MTTKDEKIISYEIAQMREQTKMQMERKFILIVKDIENINYLNWEANNSKSWSLN